MTFRLLDGRGSANTHAGVNSDNRLMTAGDNNLTGHFISRDDGLAFTCNAHSSSASAGTNIFYFKNTSATRDFFVDLVRFGAVPTALWKVWGCTGTAAGGNAITPTNLNRFSGSSAEATVRGDGEITGLTRTDQISNIRNAANSSVEINYNDILILGQDDAITVEYDTGTSGVAEIFLRGFFKDRDFK